MHSMVKVASIPNQCAFVVVRKIQMIVNKQEYYANIKKSSFLMRLSLQRRFIKVKLGIKTTSAAVASRVRFFFLICITNNS